MSWIIQFRRHFCDVLTLVTFFAGFANANSFGRKWKVYSCYLCGVELHCQVNYFGSFGTFFLAMDEEATDEEATDEDCH